MTMTVRGVVVLVVMRGQGINADRLEEAQHQNYFQSGVMLQSATDQQEIP